MSAETKDGWKTQRFSRNSPTHGFGVELLRPNGDVVAEVFASDDEDRSFLVSTDNNDIPVVIMEWFLARARSEIAFYTDGRSLPA